MSDERSETMEEAWNSMPCHQTPTPGLGMSDERAVRAARNIIRNATRDELAETIAAEYADLLAENERLKAASVETVNERVAYEQAILETKSHLDAIASELHGWSAGERHAYQTKHLAAMAAALRQQLAESQRQVLWWQDAFAVEEQNYIDSGLALRAALKQVETLKRIIDSADGKDAASFDWSVLGEMDRLEQQVERLRSALQELYALVNGECPSILDEDSGGSAHTDMMVQEALLDSE